MEWQTKQTRTATIEPVEVQPDDRTIRLAFASETPVERSWGTEVLDINDTAIRAERLNGGSVPLLLDHDMTRQIGVVEGWEIGADKVARATVRFGRSALSTEILNDVADGIRRNVSVGYQIHQMADRKGVMRATSWEPLEISIVSVPADASVGIGRAADTQEVEVVPTPATPAQSTPSIPSKERTMSDTTTIENQVREAEQARSAKSCPRATSLPMRAAKSWPASMSAPANPWTSSVPP